MFYFCSTSFPHSSIYLFDERRIPRKVEGEGGELAGWFARVRRWDGDDGDDGCGVSFT